MNLKPKIESLLEKVQDLEDLAQYDYPWQSEENQREFLEEIDQIIMAVECLEEKLDQDKEAGVLKETLN